MEWARLALNLRASLGDEAPDWLLPSARSLFERAVADGWAVDGRPGFVYTTDWDGTPVVRHRMHWVAAEATATAAVLHAVTGDPSYASWYETWWDHIDLDLRDRDGGSWWHELDGDNQPSSTVWSGKPDTYHALQATLVPRLPAAPSFAHGPGRRPARPLTSLATPEASRRPAPLFRHCRRERGGGYGDGMVRAGGWRWRRTGNCAPYGAVAEPLTSARRGCGCRRQVCLVETGCCLVAGPRLRPAVRPPRAVTGPPVGPRSRNLQGRCGPRAGPAAAGRARGDHRLPARDRSFPLPVLPLHTGLLDVRRDRAAGARVCAAEAGSRPGGCCAATPGPPEGTTPSRMSPARRPSGWCAPCGAAAPHASAASTPAG